MRTYSLALLLLAGLALVACGDDEIAGARVRLITSAADGAVQGEVQLQAVDDGVGRVYPAKPLGDDVYVAPGAPPGKYRILSTAGWGMLWSGRTGSSAPLLRGAGHTPALVRMGKPRSLYVASGLPGQWTLGATWAAEWKVAAEGDRATWEPVDLRIEPLDEGVFALRFPAEVWSFGRLIRVLGTMSDGTVTAMQTYQVRDEKRAELPRMALVLAAVQAPLTVHLVPPPGVKQVPDGTPVRVRLLGVPLDHVYEGQSYEGRAQFDELAALGHALRVELPQSGPDAMFTLDPETWRLRQSLHVVAVDPEKLADVQLVELGGGFTEARVCYRGASTFGRVSFERVDAPPDAVEHSVRVRTHPGWQEWWLRTVDGEWLYMADDIEGPPHELLIDTDRTDGAGVRVSGRVPGAPPGTRVLARQVHEAYGIEGEEVLPERRLGGEGFEAAVSPQGGYDLQLPPGRYEIRVLGPTGASSRPKVMPFAPGAQVRLDLSMR